MRIATLTLALAAFAALAGSADAHWLVEQETPLGTLCLIEDDDLPRGIRDQDVALILAGTAAIDCAHEAGP